MKTFLWPYNFSIITGGAIYLFRYVLKREMGGMRQITSNNGYKRGGGGVSEITPAFDKKTVKMSFKRKILTVICNSN